MTYHSAEEAYEQAYIAIYKHMGPSWSQVISRKKDMTGIHPHCFFVSIKRKLRNYVRDKFYYVPMQTTLQKTQDTAESLLLDIDTPFLVFHMHN